MLAAFASRITAPALQQRTSLTANSAYKYMQSNSTLSFKSIQQQRKMHDMINSHSSQKFKLRTTTTTNTHKLSVWSNMNQSLLTRGCQPITPLGLALSNRSLSKLYSKRMFSSVSTSNNLAAPAAATPVVSNNNEDTALLQSSQVDPRIQRRIAYWLFACCALVFGMVVLGGATRLTRSGLSMVDWKPLGHLPPMTEEEWQTEFNRYKQYPEYKQLGREMPLSEFKFIYFMEYSHRMLGRFIGVVFGLPLAYFAARGYLSAPLKARLGLLFAMGGCQAAVGWWMVKSGLEEQQHSYNDLPRVSPYRLATHLISAFLIYGLLFSTGLQVKTLSNLAARIASSTSSKSFHIPRSLKGFAVGLSHLVGLTAFSGAFVAGNEAGLAHNDFPKMGGQWIPDDLINPAIQPAWKNVFENSTLVQFNHRILGILTGTACAGAWFLARRAALPAQAILASNALVGMAGVQVLLGITTLMNGVPVPLAATHQAGSLTLLTIALWFAHTLQATPAAIGGVAAAGVIRALQASSATTASASVSAAGIASISLVDSPSSSSKDSA